MQRYGYDKIAVNALVNHIAPQLSAKISLEKILLDPRSQWPVHHIDAIKVDSYGSIFFPF
jgi:hypothetical protein